ncbi:nucleotide-diphospho-sugar transferase [Apiosordaria backusii]|uniref:Nucleotide-diphospho-sugar transferase n=1 Tax=Apiosordaria backusii TaxID=314023 RepID=A0AA40BN41_9PEZI|nr:nucleotide-diphospho-sugar transferase [Apiosordaria backusii]
MKWRPARLSSPLSPLLPISPLASPTLGTLSIPSKLRNRIPSQMRRTFPAYILIVTLLILLFKAEVFPSHPIPAYSSAITKRGYLQKPLGSSSSHHSLQDGDFPKKIWQTWKVDPYNFAKRDKNTARSWTTKNPGYRYEVLTDHNDVLYVEAKYGSGPGGLNRPDIVDFYKTVTAQIIKADLLRYMIMYADGGIYADIDVEALKPAERFIPTRYNASDIDMVIGVEIDQPEFKKHEILGSKCMSFCQWTFMCKPGLPVMLKLIENIMSWLEELAKAQNVSSVGEVELAFDEVISGTGPSAFTGAILEDMNSKRKGRGQKISWDHTFHNLDESKLVERVLVLDVEKFAAGQGHSNSGNHDARGALVKHHYHASNWPSKHPRFKHPAYGEVERCNWDAECVRKWDEDVAKWDSLSEKQKKKILEIKKREYEQEMERLQKEKEQAEALERLGQAERERKKLEEEERQKKKARMEEIYRKAVEDEKRKKNQQVLLEAAGLGSLQQQQGLGSGQQGHKELPLPGFTPPGDKVTVNRRLHVYT